MLQQPRFVSYPTNMKFPKAIQKQTKVVDELIDIWSREDTEYAHRQEIFDQARNKDAAALREAAIAGQADPGIQSTLDAERALAYQAERVKAIARAVSKESSALLELFKEHRLELISEACRIAEITVEDFRSETTKLSTRAKEIERARNEGLAPLRWVSSLTDGDLSYEPNFPLEGGFQVPRSSELKALGIVALLRKLYLEKKSAA